jgi:hypothetical protein
MSVNAANQIAIARDSRRDPMNRIIFRALIALLIVKGVITREEAAVFDHVVEAVAPGASRAPPGCTVDAFYYALRTQSIGMENNGS